MKIDFIHFASLYYQNISHPLAVASSFEELSDEWIVALFHDLLEDTLVKKEEIYVFLLSYKKEYLISDIVAITRKKEETYFDYIKRLDGIAKNVKLADLRHNLSRVDTLTYSLKCRYEKAVGILCPQIPINKM